MHPTATLDVSYKVISYSIHRWLLYNAAGALGSLRWLKLEKPLETFLDQVEYRCTLSTGYFVVHCIVLILSELSRLHLCHFPEFFSVRFQADHYLKIR
jgi:hypothetical protein